MENLIPDFCIVLLKKREAWSILAAITACENSRRESRNRLTNETRGSAQSVAPAGVGVHLNCCCMFSIQLFSVSFSFLLFPSLSLSFIYTYVHIHTLSLSARYSLTNATTSRMHCLVWSQAVETYRRSYDSTSFLPSLCGTPRRIISLTIVSCKALPTDEASILSLSLSLSSDILIIDPRIFPSVRTVCLMLSSQVYLWVWSQGPECIWCVGLQITRTEKIQRKAQMRHTANEVPRSDYFAQIKFEKDVEKYRVFWMIHCVIIKDIFKVF